MYARVEIDFADDEVKPTRDSARTASVRPSNRTVVFLSMGIITMSAMQIEIMRRLPHNTPEGEREGAKMKFDLSAARNTMQKEGLDCMVATTRQNVYYSTGHHVSTIERAGRFAAAIFPLNGDPVYCLETNEAFEAKTWITDVRVYKEGGEWEPLKPLEFVARVLEEKKLAEAKIGMEISMYSCAPAGIPVTYYNYLRKLLPEAEILDCGHIFERMRAVKTAEEIEIMEKAAAITSEAITTVFETAKWGETEQEVLFKMVKFCADRGLVGHGYVDAGPNTFKTHHKTSDYRIKKGDMIHTDFGVVVQGYSSDVARAAKFGEPDTNEVKTYEFATGVMLRVAEMLVPGNTVMEVHNAAKKFYEDRRVEYRLVEDQGRDFIAHGLGLAVHEVPFIGPSHGNWVIEPGMIIAIEPRVTFGNARVHYEDMFLVTEKEARNISQCGDFSKMMVIN